MAMTLKERIEHAEAAGFRLADLARACGVTSGAVSQWKSRTSTLKGENALALASFTGWPVEWWQRGFGPPPKRGGKSQAHVTSLSSATVLPTITWEAVMDGVRLPEAFTLVAPDNAMAPTIQAGRGTIWTTNKVPAVGDGILIRDKAGQIHIRRMHQGARIGHFYAVPINPAFRTLDSDADGLTILAVFDGLRGGLSSLF